MKKLLVTSALSLSLLAGSAHAIFADAAPVQQPETVNSTVSVEQSNVITPFGTTSSYPIGNTSTSIYFNGNATINVTPTGGYDTYSLEVYDSADRLVWYQDHHRDDSTPFSVTTNKKLYGYHKVKVFAWTNGWGHFTVTY